MSDRFNASELKRLIGKANTVGEDARNQIRMRVSDWVDELLPMVSMDFATIPPKELFVAHYEAYLFGKTGYVISHPSGHVGSDDHAFCEGGDFSCDELYGLVCKAVEMFNKGESDLDDEHSAISLASSVMYTLRFEWI